MGSSLNVAISLLVRRQGNTSFIISGGADFLLIIAWDHKFSQLKVVILLFFNLQKYVLKKFIILQDLTVLSISWL
jgi:hypothetical protein